jgi:hypothetical protein
MLILYVKQDEAYLYTVLLERYDYDIVIFCFLQLSIEALYKIVALEIP